MNVQDISGDGMAKGGMIAFVTRLVGRFLRVENAAISPMFALLLVPIAGSVAYAVELGGMHYVQRSMQNAADAAAIAAASNNNQTGTGTSPQMEARAAARPYGYVNGQNGQTVTAGVTTCPTGVTAGATCYEAIITDSFPLALSRVVGFFGDGAGRQSIRARAVATAGGGGGGEDVCIWTLSGDVSSFTSNGGPRPDLAGCSLFSNGGMTCNGHDLGADNGIAVGTSSGCGETQISNANPVDDPYDDLASNIPASALPSCGGTFHQLTGNGNNKTVNPANRIASGTPGWAGTERVFCGDVQLQGDVTLTGTTTLIIENGRLDLKGHTLKTASGAAATIVYSGNNNGSYHHYPMSTGGGGIIDIQAPTSGPWSGVAMYGDPAVSANTSFTYTGNSPAWKITGLVYLPHADLTFSGVVNKASNGSDCFVLVAYSLLVNGTAQMFANTSCATAGLEPPNVILGPSLREKLVL